MQYKYVFYTNKLRWAKGHSLLYVNMNILLIIFYSITLLFFVTFSPETGDYVISISLFLILSCNFTLS